MSKSNLEDTIVAVSTPIGEGGISIVRLSGHKALKIIDAIFVSKEKVRPSKFKTYTVHYGHIADKKSKVTDERSQGKFIDEVILTAMKAPKSYTKEDVVEINCHGGLQATKKVLELVMKHGARIAEPGEFTKRAFLNGRLDLSQAEAVLDIIRAKTETSLKVAMSQLEGELSKKIDGLREDIIDVASQVEASIDFPEEESGVIDKKEIVKKVEDILDELRGLIDTYSEGMIFREGVFAIICGKPNVGKSSLMNLLLKRDRVIVSPIPGTTRDVVEELINLKGIPIRLMDTAGIAEAKDILGREGVNRSKKYLALADIVLLMLDGSTEIDREDMDIMKLVGDKKKLVIINKIDLAKKINAKNIKDLFKDYEVIEISVEKRNNIELLEEAIKNAVWKGDFTQGEGAIVNNVRHRQLLDRSLESMLSVKKSLEEEASPELVAIDLKEAIYELGLIIGRSVSDDILDRIFEQFCIGK